MVSIFAFFFQRFVFSEGTLWGAYAAFMDVHGLDFFFQRFFFAQRALMDVPGLDSQKSRIYIYTYT